MKKKNYEEIVAKRRRFDGDLKLGASGLFAGSLEGFSGEMGLAAGGVMWQEVYEDLYGIDAWEQTILSRCYVHIVNSEEYSQLTGNMPPTKPPTAKDYTNAGLPWFEYYADNLKALSGSKTLSQLDSVAAKGIKKGEVPLPENDSVKPTNVLTLGTLPVREGKF